MLGLWATDVHKDWTTKWALELSYTIKSAEKIGEYDEAVDKGTTSPFPIIGDQSFHFNRNGSGQNDSRLVHFRNYLKKAKDCCNWDTEQDDPQKAVENLGTALHPLQDWVAHGDFGVKNKGSVWIYHNFYSEQTSLGSNFDRSAVVDNIEYDSEGPYGRATLSVMHERKIMGVIKTDWAYFYKGRGMKRFNKTRELTKDALTPIFALLKAYKREPFPKTSQ